MVWAQAVPMVQPGGSDSCWLACEPNPKLPFPGLCPSLMHMVHSRLALPRIHWEIQSRVSQFCIPSLWDTDCACMCSWEFISFQARKVFLWGKDAQLVSQAFQPDQLPRDSQVTVNFSGVTS